jgi:dimethylamine monooxygenase subunit A
MIRESNGPSPYLPFDGRPFRQRIGQRPLDLTTWIEPDDRFDLELGLKHQLLRNRHNEVFEALPFALPASEEVDALLSAHMQTYYPGLVRVAEPGLHPLDVAGRRVQEDLCLLVEREGELVLAAASLCFPGRWRLREKIGKPMLAIHQPVARYATDIGKATDDLLARLTVDRPIWRLNWSLVDDETLFQPTGHGVENGEAVPPAELFLRVERQTLRRLPDTGAILFTIRTYVRPLDRAFGGQVDRQQLASTLETMPDDVRAYKSLTAVADQAIAWLRAGGSSAGRSSVEGTSADPSDAGR